MTIACPDCGTLQDLSPLRSGDVAVCKRCDRTLERTSGRSITAGLALALTTWMLLFPANLLPLLTLQFGSHRVESRFATGVIMMGSNGWVLLAILVGLFTIILPFVRFGLLSFSLGCVYAGRRPRLLGPVFRWAVLLDRWTMPDVALIGAAIGYSRAAARTNVSIDAGGYCFIAAALLCMLSRAALDRRTVWRAIQPDVVSPGDVPLLSCTTCDLVQPMTHEGSPCPRCGERLRARLPDSMLRTLALLVAGALIYAPANFYPMTVTHFVGRSLSYRIIDGVRDLFQAGLWPLGVLIFITSIAIPGLKLIGLGWLQFSIVRRSRRHLRFKSGLYRFIDEVGRWSNVDPFTVPVFVPLFHYRDLVFTDAGGGATAFIFVVVVTMAASRTFDPRLMWDAASEPLHGA